MLRKSFIFSVGLAVITISSLIPITAPLSAAQQRGEKQDPRSKTKNTEAPAKPAAVIAPIDPAPITGAETRKQNADGIAIQRDLASSTSALAKDTHDLATYTFRLVIVGGFVGIAEILVLIWQAVYTGRSAQAALLSARAAIAAQRPYVSLSHLKPGLIIDEYTTSGSERQIPSRATSIKLRVQNDGATPATISHVLVQPYFGTKLPKKPPYKKAQLDEVRYVLPKGDHFEHSKHWNLPSSEISKAQAGFGSEKNRLHLWIFGYVEYTDLSGMSRRTGYARVYDPWVDSKTHFRVSGDVVTRNPHADGKSWDDRNNLPLVIQAGYNYDIEIGKEGKTKS